MFSWKIIWFTSLNRATKQTIFWFNMIMGWIANGWWDFLWLCSLYSIQFIDVCIVSTKKYNNLNWSSKQAGFVLNSTVISGSIFSHPWYKYNWILNTDLKVECCWTNIVDIGNYWKFFSGKSDMLLLFQVWVLETHIKSASTMPGWMSSNFLKLNDDKTEFIILGSKHQIAKFPTLHLSIGTSQICPSDKVRNLGAIFFKQRQ